MFSLYYSLLKMCWSEPGDQQEEGGESLFSSVLWISEDDVLQAEGGSVCCQSGIYDSIATRSRLAFISSKPYLI